jgi:hypothetical protein
MVPSAGSARPQLKRGLMSSAVILRTVSSMAGSSGVSGDAPSGASWHHYSTPGVAGVTAHVPDFIEESSES